MVESACNLTISDKCQAFNTLEVCVLNGQDALFGEKRLGVVVDELTVHEAVDAMGSNRLNLGLHLFL